MKTYKKTTVLLFLLFGFFSAIGQPGFNKIIDAGYFTNHLKDMIVVNDTVIGYGLAKAPGQGLLLVKIDSSGNLLNSNIIIDTLGGTFSIDKNWGKITATSDGGYAMTTATVFRNSAFLIKVNNNLEMEFIKEYPDTVNASNFNYSILKINDGFILYGAIQDAELVDRPFVRRVDENGEIVWHRYFGNPNFWGNILDVDIFDDSTLVIGSVENTTFALTGPNASAKTVIRYFTFDGNMIDSWESEPDPEIGYLRKINVADDGSLIIYGISVVYIDAFGTKILQPTFSKLTRDFEIEWTKRYGRTAPINAQITFRYIEPTMDGNYIAAGENFTVVNGDERGTGWLMKFSPEGDSIWSRQVLPPFPPDLFNDQFFGGVGVLSSGSIVAGGQANDHGERYIWLVKVGSDGCLEEYSCGLVVTGVEEEVPEGAGGLLVYPNPANSTVTIELKEGALSSDGLVVFFNAQGQEVLRKILPAKNRENTFSVEHLLPGLFYIEIKDSGHNTLQQSKLIINH